MVGIVEGRKGYSPECVEKVFYEVHPNDGYPSRYPAGAAPETATLKAAPSGMRESSSL